MICADVQVAVEVMSAMALAFDAAIVAGEEGQYVAPSMMCELQASHGGVWASRACRR